MTSVLSSEKKELIKKMQEAVGRSSQRLTILKEINKRESIKELIERLEIPQPTVSRAITRFQCYDLITPVKKKNNSQVFDKISLLKQIGSLDKWYKTKIEVNEVKPSIKNIKVKPNVEVDAPFLNNKIVSDAKKMAESPYYIMYLLENSIRKFIDVVLTKKHGKNWWNIVVTKSAIKSEVQTRKNLENKNKWHVPRGAHELFYTDLDDLPYFLNKEKNEFDKYLDVDLWTTKINKEIKLSRNIIDHHNPLPQREINRLEQSYEDWKRQLKNVKI